MRENPTWASTLGDSRYDDRWDDLSLDAIQASHQADVEVLRQLDRLQVEQLTPSDRIHYQLFRQQYELRVAGHRFRWFLVPLNQRGGIQEAGDLADSLTFDRVADYENWLVRMRTFPTSMEQTIALLRQGAAEKIVHSRVVMERLPAQIRKQITDDPRTHLFFKPFRSFPGTISAAERDRLSAEAERLVRDVIVPEYRRLLTFFETEYLPACPLQVGVWQLPLGAELYTHRCREFTTTDLSPDQIHEIGLAEVARIRREMEAIVRDVGWQGTFGEFLEHLRSDPQFYFENANDLLDEYRSVSKRVDPQLVKLFRKLPRMPYGVEPIPDHIAPDTTTGYYRPPAADGSRAGTYFVNLYRPETRPRYEIEALTLHESVPGHHLQIALAQEEGDLPQFRRYSGYTAYVEGWALYAESLGAELGLYKDPYSRFGRLTYEMWRAIRLVVDTGMHHKRWTRAQAIELFLDNTAKSELDIENEVDRYIAWPGQALAYKIGELKIQELRRRAEDRLGDRFDVREFHDVVLRSGAVTLDVLESLVDEWIERRCAESPRAQ
jgi:prolyl oligopeptidase